MLGRDVPVAHGPESRHYTPSATMVLNQTFRTLMLSVMQELGVGTYCQDRERQGCRARAYKDVLAASPGSRYPPPAPPGELNGTAVYPVVLIKNVRLKD